MPEESSASPRDQTNPSGGKISDHLANERTALAWVRTSLAIIGLGFVISRFGLFLRVQLKSELPQETIHFSTVLGLGLVAIGIFTLIGALFVFIRVRTAIERNQFHARPSLLIPLMGVLALIGVGLFIYMWLVR